jgi:hypothetical protein
MELSIYGNPVDVSRCNGLAQVQFYRFVKHYYCGVKMVIAGSFALSQLIRYLSDASIPQFLPNDLDIFVFARGLNEAIFLSMAEEYCEMMRNNEIRDANYRPFHYTDGVRIDGVFEFVLVTTDEAGSVNESKIQMVQLEYMEDLQEMDEIEYAHYVLSSFDIDIVKVAMHFTNYCIVSQESLRAIQRREFTYTLRDTVSAHIVFQRIVKYYNRGFALKKLDFVAGTVEGDLIVQDAFHPVDVVPMD